MDTAVADPGRFPLNPLTVLTLQIVATQLAGARSRKLASQLSNTALGMFRNSSEKGWHG